MLYSISVVVPVYNSEPTIQPLVKRLVNVLEEYSSEYEIILVNDGSRDASWKVIECLSNHHAFVSGINLMRNYGQHNALLCGIRAAKHDLIVTIDDDLQHPPEEIPKLVEQIDEGNDVVYGTPLKEQHGLWRDLASRITKISLQSAMGAANASSVSAFRCCRTRLRRAFANYRSPFVSIDVLLTWGTTKITAIPVQHEPRLIGASNYTFKKLIVHALNMMTGFSTLPLRIGSLVGFAFTIFGFMTLIFVLGRYLLGGSPVPGFPFLASIVSIFSGAQLFALGIMGEYLARIHHRSMERPPYEIITSTNDLKYDRSLRKEMLDYVDLAKY